ncbi:MAG: hypothetical protein CR984_05315 [Proteobacteria bacterium]|nr:MAG: hypothetical protein CR984_05315 [Pseudomonadota bacterium]
MDRPPPESSIREMHESMDRLALADPEAAQRLGRHLAQSDPSVFAHGLDQIVEEVIEALSIEITFGRTLADGMGRMLARGTATDLDRYRQRIAAAITNGPTLAGLLARHLVPILINGDNRLIDRFEAASQLMLAKGTYTFKAPLETLSALIKNRDMPCAHAFVNLLQATYALDTSYNRTVYLTHTLPRAVRGFNVNRRVRQINGLIRIIRTDERLTDDYLQGISAGLDLLSGKALDEFINRALRRYQQSPEQGHRFLALESRQAMDLCRDLQVAVTLPMVRSTLERYLAARTGMAVSVRPLADFPHAHNMIPDTTRTSVACDGRSIYLPDELGFLKNRAANQTLYKILTRLEAGSIEFGTFELDVEKALDAAGMDPPASLPGAGTERSDLARLIECFEHADRALDLFILYEHGRIARNISRFYPGLHRRLTAAQARTTVPTGSLWPLYAHLVLDEPLQAATEGGTCLQSMAEQFHQAMASGNATVEISAILTVKTYPLMPIDEVYRPLVPPFGRRLHPSAFAPFSSDYHLLATDICNRLKQCDIRIYRSDIQNLLTQQSGAVNAKTILLLSRPMASTGDNFQALHTDLEALLCNYGLGEQQTGDDAANAFRYREWDWCMGDYLPDRVRVREHETHLPDPRVYPMVLSNHRSLIKRIRYAFELLRPEEITILRQWREGDDLDYRALIDYTADKKAGHMPSDRLFVKRMKRVRDVAAMLLVDLSRSTANRVDDDGTRVVDVEKQAIVLLCEALTVVGDRFAIAGFSGTGPLGVDYYRIKDFDEPVDDTVKGRIGAMAPCRNTRMGAAIRHATMRLSAVTARVKLMIVLGDGFPNDLAYKGPYAVEDTRRSIMEARSEGIHVKAITVNISDNGQLDRLYGSTHHTIIGNVRDLPDKLVRVYSVLTQH